ncbi:MAG TPA: efflux RND transporter periplasmic adaptor subunit [Nitrospiria bacterium]|nr:efflux RND transporter periplasmic adaptor subunit [Nitrospiria bacterium]
MKRSVGIIILILLLAIGLAALWMRGGARDTSETTTVEYGNILKQIAARGRVEAKTTVDLSSKVDGRIEKLGAREGDRVDRGEEIITLEDDYARASIDQAKAELKEADRKYARTQRLFQSKAIPKSQLDEAETNQELARAQLERAQALMNDMHIASPIRGKVIDRYREAGESVKAGVPILTVADLSSIRVKAEIDEDDVGGLALKQIAVITSDAYPGRSFSGKVIEIGDQVGKRTIKLEDPSKISDTKILEAKIEIPQDTPFKLGMTVDIKIDLARRDHVLKIERRAIRHDERGDYATVLKDGRKEIRRVELGAMDRWDAEVVKGLNEGEKVLLP